MHQSLGGGHGSLQVLQAARLGLFTHQLDNHVPIVTELLLCIHKVSLPLLFPPVPFFFLPPGPLIFELGVNFWVKHCELVSEWVLLEDAHVIVVAHIIIIDVVIGTIIEVDCPVLDDIGQHRWAKKATEPKVMKHMLSKKKVLAWKGFMLDEVEAWTWEELPRSGNDNKDILPV